MRSWTACGKSDLAGAFSHTFEGANWGASDCQGRIPCASPCELRRLDRSVAHIAFVLGVSASAVQRALAELGFPCNIPCNTVEDFA